MNKILDIYPSYFKTIKFCGKLSFNIATNTINGSNIRRDLIELGPTYVKLGQLISTRTDIFPKKITSELSSLQSAVPGFEYYLVEDMFIEEFNYSVDYYFNEFDKKPIASASIGQVHKAMLKKSNKEVVVKVQRPLISYNFNKDKQVINDILNIISIFDIKVFNDVIDVIEESIKSIEYEFDFENEYNNTLIFNNILKYNEDIISPRVYSKLRSKKILVLEYVPGSRINDFTNLTDQTRRKLCFNLLRNFTKIVLDHGYIHSDPHPGNIGVTKNDKIILYDYGSITKLNINLQDTLKQIFYAFVDKDVEKLMNLLLKYEIIYATETFSKNVKNLSDFEYVSFHKIIEYLIDYIEEVDISNMSNKIALDELIDTNNIPLRLNRDFMIFLKSISTLEGVCKELYPTFNYVDIFDYIALEYLDFDFVLSKAKTDMSRIFNKNTKKSKIDQKRVSNMKLSNINNKVNSLKTNIYILLSFLFIDIFLI